MLLGLWLKAFRLRLCCCSCACVEPVLRPRVERHRSENRTGVTAKRCRLRAQQHRSRARVSLATYLTKHMLSFFIPRSLAFRSGRTLILNLGTRWGWVVSVTPRPRFTSGERTPGTHWIGSWMGPRAGLDGGARRKILCPFRGSKPDRPARSQTLYCLSCCLYSHKLWAKYAYCAKIEYIIQYLMNQTFIWKRMDFTPLYISTNSCTNIKWSNVGELPLLFCWASDNNQVFLTFPAFLETSVQYRYLWSASSRSLKFLILSVKCWLRRSKGDNVIVCRADRFPECFLGPTPFCVCRTDSVKPRRAGPINSAWPTWFY
jgi:hypothetical protein